MTGKIKIIKHNPATLKGCNSIIKKAIFQCFIFLTQSLGAPGGTTLDMNSGIPSSDLLKLYLAQVYVCLQDWFWSKLSPVMNRVKTTQGHFKTNHIAILYFYLTHWLSGFIGASLLGSPLLSFGIHGFEALGQLWVLLLQSLARIAHKGWLTEADSKEI